MLPIFARTCILSYPAGHKNPQKGLTTLFSACIIAMYAPGFVRVNTLDIIRMIQYVCFMEVIGKYGKHQICKTGVKTAVKKVNAAVESGDKAAAQEALKAASSTINRAASKGVLHKNNAARKVSRLSEKVSKLA